MKKLRHAPVFGEHHKYIIIPGICTLFLILCVSAVLSFFRSTTEKEFSSMADTTLNAYIANQREDTKSKIEKATNTLSVFASLIGQGGNQEFIDTYLQALNDNDSDITFLYSTARQFEDAVNSGSTREQDAESLRALAEGRNIVSDITYSQRMGDIYCFAIGVPVFEDGKLIGALRGIFNADILVSTAQYPPSQQKIIASLVCNDKGEILPVSTDKNSPKGPLSAYLAKEEGQEIPADALKQLDTTLGSEQYITRSIPLCQHKNISHYISVTDLGYHDWNLVIVLQADMAASHSSSIIHNNMVASAALIVTLIIVCLAILLSFLSLHKKLKAEERRYLLLAQFSDTVLFDYTCANDTITFTPNACELFFTRRLTVEDFVKNLSSARICKDDLPEIWQIIDFPKQFPEGEIRLRLMHPESETYFWCLVQYRCLFENGRRISIVGKITDITSQTRHEEHLIALSEQDGLTGLNNKKAAEEKIQEYLLSGRPGLLFMVDIDDFKRINDRYGHLAGDKAICYVAECLKRIFRSADILGRIGGDEMIAFMTVSGKPQENLVKQKMDSLFALLGQHTQQEGFSISLSIGISCSPEHGKSYRELYSAADKAMYGAKQHGKHQYCFYHPEDKEA